MTTGDQGFATPDGYVQFVGRDDDVITSAGYRIGPGRDRGLPDPPPGRGARRRGRKADPVRTEIVKAFVVLKPGFRPARNSRRRSSISCAKDYRPTISARDRVPRRPAADHDRQGHPPPLRGEA
jgi:acetyl-CoA synthetase